MCLFEGFDRLWLHVQEHLAHAFMLVIQTPQLVTPYEFASVMAAGLTCMVGVFGFYRAFD